VTKKVVGNALPDIRCHRFLVYDVLCALWFTWMTYIFWYVNDLHHNENVVCLARDEQFQPKVFIYRAEEWYVRRLFCEENNLQLLRFVALVVVGMDVVFAIDSVPAILAITMTVFVLVPIICI
jgi:predicted tellurium resistance membrane protein TerC